MGESRVRFVSGDVSLAVASARIRVRRRPVGRPVRSVSLDDVDTERDLMGAEVVNPSGKAPDVPGVPELRNVRVTGTYGGSRVAGRGDSAWYSRPSRGERPRVQRPVSVMAGDDLETAILDLRERMVGRKGKSRQLLRAKIERLERLLEPVPTFPEPPAKGCLPSSPTDTLAHGRRGPYCEYHQRPERDCACESTSRYATAVDADGTARVFDRETGEYLTWVRGGVSVGGDWRDPATADRVRASWPEGTGEYR